MACESELERRSSFPLVVGLLGFFLVVLVGMVTWGIRQAYDKANAMSQATSTAMTWMMSDPKIAAEIGTFSGMNGGNGNIEEFKGYRILHETYHLTGSKNSVDVEVWMKQFPGTGWTVLGAIMTTTDKRTITIGTPPAPAPVAGKKD